MNKLSILPAAVAVPPAADTSRAHRTRRLKLVGGLLTLVCTWSAVTAASAVAATGIRHVPASQAITGLLFSHPAYRSPSTSSGRVASVPAQTPITGEQTTLPVIGRHTGTDGRQWLRVMLPGRPNGLTGWIEQGGTRELTTGWHIYVNVAAHRVWIYRDARLQEVFTADVGNASTPTPTGNFFVEENVIMPTNLAGGPFALALSARSKVLQTFDGGPGQIAIHGRNFIGGPLGESASHGCVRLATPALTWLANRIGPGVPVSIFG